MHFSMLKNSEWVKEDLLNFKNLNKYNLLPNVVFKNSWMGGKHRRP